MRRTFSEMSKEFSDHWKHYVFQCLLASFSVFLIVIVMGLDHQVMTASLGATAFIVFALPEKVTAQPQNVIGGHAVGIICGHFGSVLLEIIPGMTVTEHALGVGLAVGLAIFVMVVVDMEHPPAAGTAFGIVTSGATLPVVREVLFFAIVLSVIHGVLRKHLHDLT